MGNYARWRASVDAGGVRRVTWICGDQHILIEEVIDTIRRTLAVTAADYVSLSDTTGFDREVWANANQYSLTPGANRMILVRDAEKLTRWGQLELWLTHTRTLPGVHLVFVSNEADLPTTTTGGKKTLKPHVAQLRAPRGSLVKCTMPAEADAISWIQRRGPLDDATARYLLTRTGGNLAAAAAVCDKLALFPQKAGAAAINALVTETPANDFTDNLIALQKRHALISIDSLNGDDRYKLVALLDSRLDLLQKLHRIQIAGQSWREATGVNPYLMRLYLPHARHYSPAACVNRRRVLAVVDDALRSGATDGVLEALVALW